MDLAGSARDSGDAGACRPGRRDSTATVELAPAATIRLAPDYLLASARNPGPVPDSVWQTWRPRILSPRIPTSDFGALGANDPRGAGTVPARHAGTLRPRTNCQRRRRAMTGSRTESSLASQSRGAERLRASVVHPAPTTALDGNCGASGTTLLTQSL